MQFQFLCQEFTITSFKTFIIQNTTLVIISNTVKHEIRTLKYIFHNSIMPLLERIILLKNSFGVSISCPF